MIYPLYIIFGIVPSIIWLLFYLKKDAHPESKRMIIKIFLCGALIVLPAILIEIGLAYFFDNLNLPIIALTFLNVFIGVALVEEFLKYLVVKEKVLKHHEFDEPVDAMIYMIVAALGFAALENLLYLSPMLPLEILPFEEKLSIIQAVFVSGTRFIGAVFLHTLCSGVIGYFLALSIFEIKKAKMLITAGIAIAVLLHGLFNFSIMKIVESLAQETIGEELIITIKDPFSFFFFIFLIIAILLGLAIFVAIGFKRLKKLKSVCKIEDNKL